MAKRQPLELGKGLEEVLGQLRMGLVALVVGVADPVVEVVGGVVAAPQNPIIGRQPVVVEHVRHIPQTLTLNPAHGGHLLSRERLGHQHMVVDRDGVAAGTTDRPRIGIGGHHRVVGPDPSTWSADVDAIVLALDRLGRGVLIDRAAPSLDG